MRSSFEHRQRKNLRFSLVLVHLVGGSERFGAAVSFSCCLGFSSPYVPVESPGPLGASKWSWIGGSKMPNRRLVCSSSPRQEHWPSRLQRTDLRFGTPIRRQRTSLINASPSPRRHWWDWTRQQLLLDISQECSIFSQCYLAIILFSYILFPTHLFLQANWLGYFFFFILSPSHLIQKQPTKALKIE